MIYTVHLITPTTLSIVGFLLITNGPESRYFKPTSPEYLPIKSYAGWGWASDLHKSQCILGPILYSGSSAEVNHFLKGLPNSLPEVFL